MLMQKAFLSIKTNKKLYLVITVKMYKLTQVHVWTVKDITTFLPYNLKKAALDFL